MRRQRSRNRIWRDMRGMSLPARSATFFFFFLNFFSRFVLNRADLGCIGRNWLIPKWLIQAEIQKKKKKKKKVLNALFELNNIPYFSSSAHFIQTLSSLTLSHSVTRLSLSLCSRLSASVSTLRLPCGCETLS